MTVDPRNGAPKSFPVASRGSGVHDEHNDLAIAPAGTIKTAVRSVARPDVHPAASFHEILPGLGKVEVSGFSRTEFQSPTDDANFSAAPTVLKNLGPVDINKGCRSRNSDPLN
jgi:hypothetical protein